MERTPKQIIEEYGISQLKSKIELCPRCGEKTLRTNPIENATSRYADVYICYECGTDEAMRGYFGQEPLTFDNWDIVKRTRGTN